MLFEQDTSEKSFSSQEIATHMHFPSLPQAIAERRPHYEQVQSEGVNVIVRLDGVRYGAINYYEPTQYGFTILGMLFESDKAGNPVNGGRFADELTRFNVEQTGLDAYTGLLDPETIVEHPYVSLEDFNQRLSPFDSSFDEEGAPAVPVKANTASHQLADFGEITLMSIFAQGPQMVAAAPVGPAWEHVPLHAKRRKTDQMGDGDLQGDTLEVSPE